VTVRIGLDFDGTLADIGATKQRFVRERWGILLEVADVGRSGALPVLGEERYVEMVEAVHGTDLVLDTAPVPGAIEVTRRLLDRYEVTLITARLDEEIELAREWLRLHGLGAMAMVHTSRGTKRDAWEAHRIDVHLDDTPSVLAEHPDAMVPALIAAPYNAALTRCLATRAVPDWLAFEALVAELAAREAPAYPSR
jgi:hypothetical protein